MTTTNGVNRVISTLTDIMPKVEAACNEVAAIGNTVGLRAINTVHTIGQQFKALDDAVTQLEGFLAQATNGGPPLDVTEPATAINAGKGPAPDMNPNGPEGDPLRDLKNHPLGVISGGR